MKKAIPEKLYRYRFYWRRFDTDNVVIHDTIFIKAKTIAAARKKAQKLLTPLHLPARAFRPLDVEKADSIAACYGYSTYREWAQAKLRSAETMLESLAAEIAATDYETRYARRAAYTDSLGRWLGELTRIRTELELLDCPIS